MYEPPPIDTQPRPVIPAELHGAHANPVIPPDHGQTFRKIFIGALIAYVVAGLIAVFMKVAGR